MSECRQGPRDSRPLDYHANSRMRSEMRAGPRDNLSLDSHRSTRIRVKPLIWITIMIVICVVVLIVWHFGAR